MIKELMNQRDKQLLEIEKREALIQKKQAQIERAKNRVGKLKDNVRWTATLLAPLAQAIIDKEGFFNKFDILGPFGLSCETSIWLWKTEEDYLSYKNHHEDWSSRVLSITFRPKGFNNEQGNYRIGLAIENGEVSGYYAKGSIGEINGFNRKVIDVDDWSLETLIAFMYEKNKNKL